MPTPLLSCLNSKHRSQCRCFPAIPGSRNLLFKVGTRFSNRGWPFQEHSQNQSPSNSSPKHRPVPPGLQVLHVLVPVARQPKFPGTPPTSPPCQEGGGPDSQKDGECHIPRIHFPKGDSKQVSECISTFGFWMSQDQSKLLSPANRLLSSQFTTASEQAATAVSSFRA